MSEIPQDNQSSTPSTFVQHLLEYGRVSVSSNVMEPDATEIEPMILELDRMTRLEMPGITPALSLPAATWALRLLHGGCRFLVYREEGPEKIAEWFGQASFDKATPSIIYSADLFLRYLPDLIRLASGVADDDPLVERLKEIAARWPMSTVGVLGIEIAEDLVDVILSDASLRQVYVDRVLERNDLTRLKHAGVRNAVRTSIGAYSQLAAEMARAIETHQGH